MSLKMSENLSSKAVLKWSRSNVRANTLTLTRAFHVKPFNLEQYAECNLLLWKLFECYLFKNCSKEVNAPTFTAWGDNQDSDVLRNDCTHVSTHTLSK